MGWFLWGKGWMSKGINVLYFDVYGMGGAMDYPLGDLPFRKFDTISP
jgi:hypothetical protein